MMIEVLNLILPLAVAILINIALGMYYKINVAKFSFEWIVLANGIVKALIIGGSFIGLAYIFDTVDISFLGDETPVFIMLGAIGLYTVKAITNLKQILMGTK
jgi:hypothetical protein